MIGVIFQFGSDTIEVRIVNTNCTFRTQDFGGAYATIDGLKLSKSGVIKEHPDLKDDSEWRTKAIQRFKQKLKDYDNEVQRMEYIVEDLKKFGYKPLYYQREGFRTRKYEK